MWAAVLTTLTVIGTPAQAQNRSCPDSGVSPAVVDVDSPRPEERVSGVVTVQGRVSTVHTVSRVELRVGPTIVDEQTFPARSSIEFVLRWDTERASPGRTTARIVSCGLGRSDDVVHGSSTVTVEVIGSDASRDRPGRDERPSGSLWVGAVMGLSGVAGLAYSGAWRGRHRRDRASVA